jgi:hypothetical protein
MMEANNMPLLEAEDISQGVLYVLGTPPRVQVRNHNRESFSTDYYFFDLIFGFQVHELTIKPVGELF